MSKDSICLSNDAQPLVWPIDGERYENLYEEEYFVNGDPINSTITPLNRITNTLDTRGLPAPLNTARTVNGFASSTSIGFAGPSPSFQRTNVVAKEKPFKKSISLLKISGNGKPIIEQNVSHFF